MYFHLSLFGIDFFSVELWSDLLYLSGLLFEKGNLLPVRFAVPGKVAWGLLRSGNGENIPAVDDLRDFTLRLNICGLYAATKTKCLSTFKAFFAYLAIS